MRCRRLLVLLVLPLAVACGDDGGDAGGGEGADDEAGGGCRAAVDGRVTLVAEDVRWDTDCLEAEAGELVIEVDNRDDGINHNVHLPDHPESPATELAPGPGRQALEVSVEAGAYEYVCDIHPNMVGTLTVTDPAPG